MQDIDATTKLMAAIEVSDMFHLVNEAFQCLGAHNLDLRKTYDQVFNLLCFWKRFFALESAMEKLPVESESFFEIVCRRAT